MPTVTPFKSIRPVPELAGRIAALPYDVYSREEALEEIKREPLSFLKIDRAETQFPADVDTYDPRVYERAKETLSSMIADGSFLIEETPCYYIYELIMDGRSQCGIVACSSIDDYQNQIIKKHENTREDKELDRIRHVDVTDTHTGPIFLVYRSDSAINRIVDKVRQGAPLYDFTSPDGITHRVWRISDKAELDAICQAFARIPCTYIADGHHRCASAVKVGLKRRSQYPDYTGEEEFNRFLSVLFPHDQLAILPYNRAVRDLNNLTGSEFLKAVENAGFSVICKEKEPILPAQKGTFGMYLENKWYLLTADQSLHSDHPVKGLDVSILQEHLLDPILNIKDPRTDKRIDFIGGIRGLSELERRVHTDMAVAFSMYPTSITELLSVADAGLLMPPKSTWFEPKLRSGLFLHGLS
ncbi:MAG: DUF1015 family protein [Lachnospiraceae bacterium]|nr:DUF1015 family protein [Lachnospiraceae bacterium]